MRIPRSIETDWREVVWPGSAAVGQTFALFRELIKLLLPTFGNPTTPTVILPEAVPFDFEPNGWALYDFSRLMSPGDVRARDERLDLCCCVEERNGKVGAECLRYVSHCSAFERGTRSILFKMNTSRLPSPSLRRTSSSTSRLRHPSGSRASNTNRMTSD